MKLILTDYIASLKEEKELDQLLQDLLREADIEIFIGPEKGERQYGVDIYAVGTDWTDGTRKIFLLTVKKGDLDRNAWSSSPQGVHASLVDITEVFIRNNILPQHKDLPVKIIVAHNGNIATGIPQSFRGFADKHQELKFEIWHLEIIVNLVEAKLYNENAVLPESRGLLRRIIILLERPDYDFKEYSLLLDRLFSTINPGSTTLLLRQLRKINFISAIILSYCQDNSRNSINLTEILFLRMWLFLNRHPEIINREVLFIFFRVIEMREKISGDYLTKILRVTLVKDGFSAYSSDAGSYGTICYEHLGLISLSGLHFLQMHDLLPEDRFDQKERAKRMAEQAALGVINLFNNNQILYSPRADDFCIEINMAFQLLFRTGRLTDISTLMRHYNEHLATSMALLKLAPEFTNNPDTITELGYNYEKRNRFEYGSSCLITVLIEWVLVVDDQELYDLYIMLMKEVFGSTELVLWFPDANTEEYLYTQKALPISGYTLSNIKMPETIGELQEITLQEYIFNCQETGFSFFEWKLWSIGLVASRHYRTYPFPHYWRCLMKNACDVKTKELLTVR